MNWIILVIKKKLKIEFYSNGEWNRMRQICNIISSNKLDKFIFLESENLCEMIKHINIIEYNY